MEESSKDSSELRPDEIRNWRSSGHLTLQHIRDARSASRRPTMKQRGAYRETIALAISASLMLGLAFLQLLLDPLHIAIRHDVWAKRSDVICSVIACYGAVLAISIVASYRLIHGSGITLFHHCLHGVRSVGHEAKATWKWVCQTTGLKQSAAWIGAMTAIAATVRGYFLAQPMRYDEAYTFLLFISKGLQYLFFYPVPNNHVLHTILVRASVGLLGSDPVAIRLPAFVAGILVVPAMFCLSRLLTRNSVGGFLAAGLCAMCPYLILYDTMARGYSLVVLLSLCLAILGYRLIEQPSTRLCALMSLITALGLLDMPSFLFPAAGIFLWCCGMLVGQGYHPRWFLTRVAIPSALMTAALTGMFYTPVIIISNGIQTIVANRNVESLASTVFLRAIPVHVSHTIAQFTRNIPELALVVGLFLAAIGCYTLVRQRLWASLALLPAMLIGGAIVFFLKRAIPFDRTWIYLIPFFFLLVDAGFGGVVKWPNGVVRGILLFCASCVAVLLMCHDTISSYDDTGTFPEAPIVVSVLAGEMNPGDTVVDAPPADFPVEYYMWRLKVPRSQDATGHVPSRTYFIVKKSRYSIKDLTTLNTRKILELGDAELYVSEDTKDRTDLQTLRTTINK